MTYHDPQAILRRRWVIAWLLSYCIFNLLVGCGEKPAAPTSPTASARRTNNPPLTLPAPQVMVVTAEKATMSAAMTAVALTLRVSGALDIVEIPAVVTHAGSVTLAWNASPDVVKGYAIYFKIASSDSWQRADVGNRLRITISGLSEGAAHDFYVVAYSYSGIESVASNQITYTIPVRIGLRCDRVALTCYGVFGKTNHLMMSTNLQSWSRILTYVGNGTLRVALHTNSLTSAFFKNIQE